MGTFLRNGHEPYSNDCEVEGIIGSTCDVVHTIDTWLNEPIPIVVIRYKKNTIWNNFKSWLLKKKIVKDIIYYYNVSKCDHHFTCCNELGNTRCIHCGKIKHK